MSDFDGAVEQTADRDTKPARTSSKLPFVSIKLRARFYTLLAESIGGGASLIDALDTLHEAFEKYEAVHAQSRDLLVTIDCMRQYAKSAITSGRRSEPTLYDIIFTGFGHAFLPEEAVLFGQKRQDHTVSLLRKVAEVLRLLL
ncbi:hypothetical protein [Thalassospira xiamenensis]|uniref:Uncharacterized protein n=1 Tax=Thalassospira xiamenensis TaxID=220697 RepID=A0A285TT01_9PROT|nr:hypothetical protein [Thalassospira xiamenensis]SOC26828.1 hypothetical protein SAMN05428964_105216 [Thalassospira xiamenensis]